MQDRTLAQEEGLSARRRNPFGLHGLGGSLVQLARVVEGLGDPVAQAVDAQLPGNMAHEDNASTGGEVFSFSRCGRRAGDCPLFGC